MPLMKNAREDAPSYEKFLNSKFVDVTLWVIVAISVVQLLWRLIADGKLWLGPLFILLMAGVSLTLRVRRRRVQSGP
jgi:hypothetical protein